MIFRVMQILETREEVNVFEGTMDECHDWIEQNCDQYPESGFVVEKI